MPSAGAEGETGLTADRATPLLLSRSPTPSCLASVDGTTSPRGPLLEPHPQPGNASPDVSRITRPAVCKMLVGSERDDKGGVEARGQAIRWQELLPIPSGPDLASISGALLARLEERRPGEAGEAQRIGRGREPAPRVPAQAPAPRASTSARVL